MMKKDWSQKQSPHYQQPTRPKIAPVAFTNTAAAVEVVCIDSYLTIAWECGALECNIPSTLLYCYTSLNGRDRHEFFPGECVIANGRREKYGVVQNVNNLQRWATVQWFTHNGGTEEPQSVSRDEMSAYDLRKARKHPKYAFRRGSVVKKIPTETDKFGTVLHSCPEGYVTVQWINGIEGKCYPKNLQLVDQSNNSNNENSAQVPWKTESIESRNKTLAARLHFVRSHVTYLKDVLKLKQHNSNECFLILEDSVMIYDNCSYVDEYLHTSFFSLESGHFQVLLSKIKEKAKMCDVELRGRLLSCLGSPLARSKNPEKENINKLLKLLNKFTHIREDGKDVNKEEGKPSVVTTPDSECASIANDMSVELLTMMKTRMDLPYAEIISRIDEPQALTVMTKASDVLSVPAKLNKSVISSKNGVFTVLDEADSSHCYYSSKFCPTDKKQFVEVLRLQLDALKKWLPFGFWVCSYGDRVDLLSVMIRGIKNTPYEDGLFLFNLQLSEDYPLSPPLCHYISYTSEQYNPYVFGDANGCVSFSESWVGNSNVWTADNTLLQLIVSIEGHILVAEPYYNEVGDGERKDSQQGYENSRTYNELVILRVLDSMIQLTSAPPLVFADEIIAYCVTQGEKMVTRLEKLCNGSYSPKPIFPLVPVSKGFKCSLTFALESFKDIINAFK